LKEVSNGDLFPFSSALVYCKIGSLSLSVFCLSVVEGCENIFGLKFRFPSLSCFDFEFENQILFGVSLFFSNKTRLISNYAPIKWGVWTHVNYTLTVQMKKKIRFLNHFSLSRSFVLCAANLSLLGGGGGGDKKQRSRSPSSGGDSTTTAATNRPSLSTNKSGEHDPSTLSSKENTPDRKDKELHLVSKYTHTHTHTHTNRQTRIHPLSSLSVYMCVCCLLTSFLLSHCCSWFVFEPGTTSKSRIHRPHAKVVDLFYGFRSWQF
jgi:hypothetical protein